MFRLVRPEARSRGASLRHRRRARAGDRAQRDRSRIHRRRPVVHEVLRLSPEDSLVLLTRAATSLSVALGVVLVRILVRRLTGAAAGLPRRPVRIRRARLRGGDLALVGRPVEPLLRRLPRRRRLRGAFRASARDGRVRGRSGVALALLSLTRSFEFVALCCLGHHVRRAHRAASDGRGRRIAHVVAGAAAFAVTTAAVYRLTGKRGLFLLYGGASTTVGQRGRAESRHADVQLLARPRRSSSSSSWSPATTRSARSRTTRAARPLPAELLPAGSRRRERAPLEAPARGPAAVARPALRSASSRSRYRRLGGGNREAAAIGWRAIRLWSR